MLDKRYEIHAAPLQGMTDAAFRAAHSKHYGGVDYYYTPFIRIERGLFRKRDIRDLADDELDNTIPQVLPGSADELKRLCEPVIESGHKLIDINIGCPFPPVMAHGRGSALLNNPDTLADVLRGATEMQPDVRFSLKMRLGYSDTHQWEDSIDAINEVGFRHVTMHARYARQQYNGECDMEAFGEFLGRCTAPVIYNGDIRSMAEAESVVERFPTVKGLMIGRGLIADLSLARELQGEGRRDEIETFRKFHAELLTAASERMTDGGQVVSHMQTYWEYMFQDADRKELKAIRKARKLDQYTAAVSTLIATLRNGR